MRKLVLKHGATLAFQTLFLIVAMSLVSGCASPGKKAGKAAVKTTIKGGKVTAKTTANVTKKTVGGVVGVGTHRDD